MEFDEVIKSRYSCKQYSDQPVSEKDLQAILEAGRLAPTAKNLQEHHIYVLASDEARAKFDSICPCRYNAPVVLVVAYDANRTFTYPGGKYDSGAEDISIVATYLMLAAANRGVNSCWVNFFDPDEMAAALDLPEGQVPVLAMDMGHVADGAGPLPNNSERRPLTETVTRI